MYRIYKHNYLLMNNAYFSIGDLFIDANIVIHSNVYKIRTSSTKEKTYICTSSIKYEVIKIPEQRILGTEGSFLGTKLICMRNFFH